MPRPSRTFSRSPCTGNGASCAACAPTIGGQRVGARRTDSEVFFSFFVFIQFLYKITLILKKGHLITQPVQSLVENIPKQAKIFVFYYNSAFHFCVRVIMSKQSTQWNRYVALPESNSTVRSMKCHTWLHGDGGLLCGFFLVSPFILLSHRREFRL